MVVEGQHHDAGEERGPAQPPPPPAEELPHPERAPALATVHVDSLTSERHGRGAARFVCVLAGGRVSAAGASPTGRWALGQERETT
jgi:hypothetical protein